MGGLVGGIIGNAIAPGIGGVIGASIGGSIDSSNAAADASQAASAAQTQASANSIEEQRRQFDALQALLRPYVNQGTASLTNLQPYAQAGAPALAQQQALIGLSGGAAQQSAIDKIAQSPEMQALTQQGENALLQNASATGGLRGGNTQAALAQFRPQLLNSLINQQYSRLGGLTSLGQTTTQNLAQIGQASAAQTGVGGLNSAAQIAALQGQAGAAQAGGILGSAKAMQGLYQIPGQLAGYAQSSGLFKNLFGGSGGSFTPSDGGYLSSGAFGSAIGIPGYGG